MKREQNVFISFAVLMLAAIFTLAGCNTLQSIEVIREPARTVYGQGQELDRSGLGVMAHYKKDSKEVNERSLQISGYDKGKPGKQTVIVAMEGKSASFTVTVVPAEQVSIQQPPAKTVFMEGDNFDATGLVALVAFENGTVPDERIGPERLSFSGYNKDRAGVQTVIADYYDKRASFDVSIAALANIAVTSLPDTTLYFTGEDLDLAGLVVTGTWEGAGERPITITPGNLSSFDKNRAGNQNVFVTYQGKTTSFPVTFVAMQSLLVERPPEKLNYENGEDLDLNGLSVQGTRAGATSIEMVDIARLKISGYDRFKGGNQTVTLTLGGRTATFRVTVTPNPFEGTWHGTWDRSTSDEVRINPITLIITENTWLYRVEQGFYAQGEYSGTYTRDNDSGKYAKLLVRDRKGGATADSTNIVPTAAQILSITEMKVTGEHIDGLTFTK
jgi:predicted small secreted protein